MSLFKSVLHNFESHLQKINAPVLKYFQMGIDEDLITDIFTRIGYTNPPKDLIELYKWKNGIKIDPNKPMPSGKLEYAPSFIIGDLMTNLKIYAEFPAPFMYKKKMFPLSSDSNLVINMDDSDAEYGKLYIYEPPLLILTPISYSDNLYNFYQSILNCFNQQIFWYDEDEFFQCDWEKHYEIFKKMNPDSIFWNYKSISEYPSR